MQVTRRFWGAVGCAGVLALGATVLESLALLAGAGLLLAWLVAAQVAFVRRLAAIDERIEHDLGVDSVRPIVDDPTAVTLSTTLDTLDETTTIDLTLALPLPPAATGDPIDTDVEDGQATAATTIEWTTGGLFTIGPPRLTAVDPLGLFVERIEDGPTVEVAPTPRRPETIHLGQGGDRVAAAYGQHTTDGTGPGIEPAELREYQPGDDVRRIDWKATARLAEPHVMESTAETDRRTVLLLDGRERMGIGPSGATAFDYARAAALALADSARDLGDPLGLFVVGDEGITTAQRPVSSPGGYERVDTALRTATPTTATTTPVVDPERGPADARRAARLLDGDDEFAETLRPLLETATPYVQRIEGQPLFETARTHVSSLQGTTWTVIVTDDAGRSELTETVDLARRGNGRVLVVLTPRCLFEAESMADLDATYDAYAEFESFRRELAGLDRVDAFELAPGERLASVLDTAEGSA